MTMTNFFVVLVVVCEGLYSASIGVTPWASGATKIWASMYLSVIHLVVYLLNLVTTIVR